VAFSKGSARNLYDIPIFHNADEKGRLIAQAAQVLEVTKKARLEGRMSPLRDSI
jgi:hypothetical protein